jgi:23S rRNA pseudouridine1911/1915/1917 synthase
VTDDRVRSWVVEAQDENLRLDVAISRHLGDVSRAQAKKWIESGLVEVERGTARASRLCRTGERIDVHLPEPAPAVPEAEPIPLDVIYEDADLIVINKPAGMVVHPSPGHESGTLVNALLAHCRDLSGVGGVLRPGIVHRLDSGTSGLLVVAKNDVTHRGLAEQFQRRSVEKSYIAIVHGTIPESLEIAVPIGRDPRDRKKVSSRSARPKAARSSVERIENLPLSSLVAVRIHTGRTHQIRVHLSEAGFPVVGDHDYGAPKPSAKPPARNPAAFRLLRGFPRPALHASALAIAHPRTGQPMRFETPLPKDMRELLAKLRDLAGAGPCAN